MTIALVVLLLAAIAVGLAISQPSAVVGACTIQSEFTAVWRDEPTDCPGSDLTDADLPGVFLRDANFAGANLTGANLNGADLRFANFEGATLDRADLSESNLYGATFRGHS